MLLFSIGNLDNKELLNEGPYQETWIIGTVLSATRDSNRLRTYILTTILAPI